MVIKVKYNGEWVKIPYLSSDHGQELVEEAPKDGEQYARQNGVWSVVNIPEVDFTEVYNAIDTKVDKVEGKGLSTNDYVTADKTKVTNINEVVEAATKNITATGISITLDKRNLVTNAVENIELDLPASTTALAGLMLPSDKTKLNGIAAGAEVNVNADWNATEGDALILNKPTIPTVDVTKSYVDTQLATKANASNVYTKAEVDSKVSSVYRVKGSVYAVATTSANGLMSSAMVTKLNGVATNANNYSLPTATGSVLGGVKTGSNITNSSGTISLSSGNVTSALGYTPVKNESGVASIRVMTQSAYDALSSKSATTLYIITG